MVTHTPLQQSEWVLAQTATGVVVRAVVVVLLVVSGTAVVEPVTVDVVQSHTPHKAGQRILI